MLGIPAIREKVFKVSQKYLSYKYMNKSNILGPEK